MGLPYDSRMFGMGIGELLVVLVIVLVVFGAGRLPR
jgi:Sec-independent protein translocase protein TatA